MERKELLDFADMLIDEANYIKRKLRTNSKIDESVIQTYLQVKELLR